MGTGGKVMVGAFPPKMPISEQFEDHGKSAVVVNDGGTRRRDA